MTRVSMPKGEDTVYWYSTSELKAVELLDVAVGKAVYLLNIGQRKGIVLFNFIRH